MLLAFIVKIFVFIVDPLSIVVVNVETVFC